MVYLKQIIRRVIDGAGDNPRAKLQFLRQRLEACPEAMSAEIRRSNGGAEIIELKK